MQKNQHIHVAIKLQHMLEIDDKFRRATGLPRLDIPEHLWGVRDMRSAHTREQDFMVITAEVEVLCQQLKGRSMYTLPSVTSTTSSSKIGGNVHFQPINPAQKSSVQAMDQSLLNLSLNLLDDSPRSQSSSSNGPIPHGQATPRVPVHKGSYPILPTPYVNQTAVDQHRRAQPCSDSTQDDLGSYECTVTKTGTITTVTGQRATTMTALRRRATCTCYKLSCLQHQLTFHA